MFERFFLRIIVVNLVKEALIEVWPLLKCKRFPEYSRTDIACNEGRFDENCARTTHRIDKIRIAFPTTHQYHSGGKYLVQRCFHAFLTVSSAVKTLAT